MNKLLRYRWSFLFSATLLAALFGVVGLLFSGGGGVATAVEPEPAAISAPIAQWCAVGEFNGWNNNANAMNDDGVDGDLIAGDGIYSADIAIGNAGRTQVKAVECDNWGVSFPSDNAWVWLTAPATVKLTFDTNDLNGNAGLPYAPSTNIVNIWGDDAAAQSYTVVGGWQGWNNAAITTTMTSLGDGQHILTYTFGTAGNYEAKLAATGNWDYQVGADGRSVNAPSIPFTVANDGDVIAFYFNALTGRLAITPSAPTSNPSTYCLAGDVTGWNPPDFVPLNDDGTTGDLIGSDGVYSVDLLVPTAGRYQFKVNICDWAVSYPIASNAWFFTSSPSQTVRITFDTNDYSSDAGWPMMPTTNIVHAWDDFATPFTAVGPWQTWNPGNPNTVMTDLGYKQHLFTYTIPGAGPSEAKVSNDGWNNQVGADGRGTNANTIPFSTTADNQVLSVYLDGTTSRLAAFVVPPAITLDITSPPNQSRVGGLSVTVAGAVAPPDNAVVVIEVNGTDSYTPTVGVDGSFSQLVDLVAGDNTIVVMADNGTSSTTAVRLVTAGNDPLDETLAQPALVHPIQDDLFYFVMPDRFDDGDPSNNEGGLTGDRSVTGFDPTDKGFYHGGDLAGLEARLDYLQDLGVTAIWMTPMFKNKPVQGTGADMSAGYHGYWIQDFTQIDPHFGTNAELEDIITAAHARDMKVFFDIITNHTADIIQYEGGGTAYRNKTDFPFLDADGNPFDDLDYAGGPTFPDLDPAISFPYVPTNPNNEVKTPAWLNDMIYYHNRGNSTFAGESSLYGDFFGLDDLFTAHPDVVTGMVDIYKTWITDYQIDGFRVDTVKHVNIQFWQQFGPEILAHAAAEGRPDFFIFGEVFSGNELLLSHYTTEGLLPAVLDFKFQGAARDFASVGSNTTGLENFFLADDYYTDHDSNAYALPTFIGNHDVGRFGYFMQADGVPAGEQVDRSILAHGLMYFSRGVPVVYYGDEQGFTGNGGDKDARQNMFPSQVAEFDLYPPIGSTANYSDDNFDPTHPLYQAFADFATVYQAHQALRTGAQIHRYSEGTAGTYAFSRIDRDELVEYVLAFNNAGGVDTAVVPTFYAAGTTFNLIHSTGTSAATLITDGDGNLEITTPAMGFVIYAAETTIPASPAAPNISINTLIDDQVVPLAIQNLDGNEILDRIEVGAQVAGDGFYEVTFAVRRSDQTDFTVIGVDNNAPYRVFYTPEFPEETPALAAANNVTFEFRAIVNDLNGNLNSAGVTGITAEVEDPNAPVSRYKYTVIHYQRPGDDYGTPEENPTDFWGLHIWGDAIVPGQGEGDWNNPIPFRGETEFGRFMWLELADPSQPLNFIIHTPGGDSVPDTREPGGDRSYIPNDSPEVWIMSGDATIYTSQASAQGFVTIHYNRPDNDYTGWGLYLWQDWGQLVDWNSPHLPDGFDDYGAYFTISQAQYAQLDFGLPLNFIVKNGDTKDPDLDRSFNPYEQASIWLKSADEAIYNSRGHADDVVTLHYRRPAGDYGDFSSNSYVDFWGLHTWGAAADPGWTTPRRPVFTDTFGIAFEVPLINDGPSLNYILHRGDEKDPGPDQFLEMAKWGYEVWQLQGADPDRPYILPIIRGGSLCGGDISKQQAYWVAEDTILWDTCAAGTSVSLYYTSTSGLVWGEEGIGGGIEVELTRNGSYTGDQFPHLQGLPLYNIGADDLAMVPDILKGQFVVASMTNDGDPAEATGLQIPGVLDDLYSYNGELGVVWNDNVPSFKLWAPTAQNVTLHIFADAETATTSTTYPMTWDANTGVWSYTGESSWKGQYYLYEVDVFVPSTGEVEKNIVTDPYSFSLSMNSKRSQIVDLADPALAPAGWDTLVKPTVNNEEEISVYELHVRDFSIFDETVPEAYRGTFKAFTVDTSNGMSHLSDLAQAGLTHLHLLPTFDIATINEDVNQREEPDYTALRSFGPASDQQQVIIENMRDLDGFNWGYDPFHYTVPEGSYSTVATGTMRIVEFREMVQSLNETGLLVVVDVVYNHTNASGQSEKSVLDRIVPGYYHRLNAEGAVEKSTCCDNTATEHYMMEKLMIDSLIVWAKYYKVDSFRFDLMGHHMKSNMLNVRAALDALTLEEDGVDGSAIYVYGEGWNFGEVANNARGVNATQANMAGTGIGTFSDRLRDAVRGPGPFNNGDSLQQQGFVNGLYYDPNPWQASVATEAEQRQRLLLLADQIRVGLAGNLKDYEFVDRNGNLVTGAEVDYNGSPAGYTDDPQEVVTYVSKHDNQTLFDINAYAVPTTTLMADRIRIQQLGLSIVSLGQGINFFHAGSDMLRSKSLDRDSYDSGDWYNVLDFSYTETGWGRGLPREATNGSNWYLMEPRLADPTLMPEPADIVYSKDLFLEWMQMRMSTPLFSLATKEEVMARLAFHNTGADQVPGVIVMSISDMVGADLDPAHESVVVVFNATDEAQGMTVTETIGAEYVLHPVQQNSLDVVVRGAAFDGATGTFDVPARTTAVFVITQAEEPFVEISVSEGETSVANGGSVAFGSTEVDTAVSKTFTVRNNGNSPLDLSSLAVTGSGFSTANFASATVAPGETTTFQVTLTATAAGNFSGTVSFNHNADNESSPFSFTVSGSVSEAPVTDYILYMPVIGR